MIANVPIGQRNWCNAELWLKRHARASGLRTADETENTLKRLIYPAWADRPLFDIRRADCALLRDKITDDRGAVSANKALR